MMHCTTVIYKLYQFIYKHLQMKEEQTFAYRPQSNIKQRMEEEAEHSNSKILQKQIKTTNEAIQQITSQIKLQNNKKIFVANQQSISLIAGNNRPKGNNETVKRSSPYSNNLRDITSNERTKDQIRMKIILQNSRLKGSIDTLKQDLESYKGNERKIIEVLRESKLKISEYKERIKAKSKKITDVTDSNINLKNKLAQLQSKINQMASFSEWQDNQIRELKSELTLQAHYKERLDELQAILKDQIGRVDSRKPNEENIHVINHSPQQFSSQSIGERTPYSIKEMQIQDLQSFKQKQPENEQFYELREANISMRNRLMELEHELDQMRTENRMKQERILSTEGQKQRTEHILKGEMDNIMEKSLQISQQLQEKEYSIGSLQNQLKYIRELIKSKEETYSGAEQRLKAEIIQLGKVIDKKSQEITELKQNLQEKDDMFKKELQEIQLQMDERQQERSNHMKQYEQKNRELIQSLQQNQHKMEELISRNEQLQNYRQESQQRINLASSIVSERRQYEVMLNKMKEEVQYYKRLPEENERCFEQKVTETDKYIKGLQKEKEQFHDQMKKYAVEIRILKNQISELNREKNDSLGSQELPHIIEEQKEESEGEIHSETSLLNGNKLPSKIQKIKTDSQIIPVFQSYPLDEQQELEEEFGSGQSLVHDQIKQKNLQIKQLRQEIENIKTTYKANLEEELKKYTIQVVQTNFKLEQEKEEQYELKEMLKKIQTELSQANNNIMQKVFQLEVKQDVICKSEKIISEKDELLTKVKTISERKDEEIKNQGLLIAKLQEHLEGERNKNRQFINKLALLVQNKAELENILQKLKQERQLLASSKDALTSSLQLELSHKRQIENQLMNSRRLVEVVQHQHLNEKTLMDQLTQELQHYMGRQKQLEDKIKLINSQKSKLHEQIILRMGEKDDFNQKCIKLSAQIEELRHFRREEIDQMKKQNVTISEQTTQCQNLRIQKQVLTEQLSGKQHQLQTKNFQITQLSEIVRKANLKIEQLQKFQQRTMKQIQEKLKKLSHIIDQQQNQIGKLNRQKEDLLNYKQKQINSLSELSSHKQHLQQSRVGLEKQLHQEIRSRTELKTQISKFHDEFDNQIEENNKLKEKIVDCEEQIRRIKVQRETLLFEKEELKKANEDIKSKLTNNQKMIKDLSLNIANLKQSLDLSHSEYEEQTNFLKESLNKENEESISLKLEQIEQSKLGIDTLKQEISQIQNKHKSVIEGYEYKLRSNSVRLEEITQEKQGKIAQLQSIVLNQKNQLNQTNQIRQNLQTTIKQLKQIVAEHLSTIQKLQQQVIQEKEMVSSKDLIISSFEKNQNIKKAEIEQKDKSIQDLQSKLALMNQSIEQKRINADALQNKIEEQANQQQFQKEKYQHNILKLTDDLQISKRMMQESEQQYHLKINKLNKELSNHKLLLQETQKQTSFRLEQSNRSITEIKTELKVYIDTIKQKDEEIRGVKESNNQLKEQYEKLKIVYNRFEEEKTAWEQLKIQNTNKANDLQQQIKGHKNQINSLRAAINTHHAEFQQLNNELSKQGSTIKELNSKLQTLNEQKRRIQIKMEKMLEQKTRLQSKLETVAIQKTKFETLCEQLQEQNKRLLKKKDEAHQEMQISTLSIIEQQKILFQKNQILIKEKQQLIQEMMENQNKLKKQYQTRIENLCLDHRGILLDVENSHSKQIERLNEEIKKIDRERKTAIQSYKDTVDQLQKLRQKFKKDEKMLKESQNQRGELTDKILQLTQQNNESSELIENLRNNVVSKGNEIEQCREIIYKLQEEMEDLKLQRSPLNSSNSIPLSIENEQKLAEASEYIEKLIEKNKQLQNREVALQQQLREKQRIEKQLYERLQKVKERENRQRNSSGDSWVSRSKIFDQKSQNILAQLEQTKNKLESAEAYIQLLEDQSHKSNSDPKKNLNDYKSRAEELQKEVQDLNIKIEYLEALIIELENTNMKSSIRSRMSVPSKPKEVQQKSAEKEPSQGNYLEEFNQKIYLLVDFIETYARDRSSGDKEEELKSKLSHPALQQLLSTIFYRLEKETIIYKDKEHMISQLHQDNENLQQELKNSKENSTFLMKKCSILEGFQKKYQDSEKMLEDLLTNKMKDEADIAQCRSYIEELENKLSKFEGKGKEEQNNKKEALEILEEQHESSSDSMMSESADSQIPSSVNQSKEFKSSVNLRNRGKGQFLSMSKSMMRTKSFNVNEQKATSSQFLRKCLLSIKELENQVQKIQKELELKTKLLDLCLGQSISKEDLINKLSMIESKIKINDRQLKNHFQTSELEVATIIRELLKYRQEQDQYGLQNQSRKKIEEYLTLLEQELSKNSKLYEQDSVKLQQYSRKSDSPSRLGASLHEIKEDAVNEDKGSSIVYPRSGQVLRSFSNSEGVTESLDINEIKHNYNQALRELHETHDQLSCKQDIIKTIYQRYTMVQQEVFLMLDEIRIYFEEDQYLFDQVEKIKKYMVKYLQEQASLAKIKDSQEKIEEEKMNILVQSHNKNMILSKKNENPFQRLVKLNEDQIRQFTQTISNENLKELYQRIEELMNERFDDCLDFLNTEKSLIADILKIRNDEGLLEATMNKLASKLTKQQISDIIQHSHNRIEANKTLKSILKDDDAKSMVSDEHDFSPNGNKIQQIRNKVYHHPTELSLSIHNQLLQILAAPTRNEFYGLIEQFYKILKNFENQFNKELSQKQQFSEKHSIRIKKALEIPRQNRQNRQNFDFSMEKFDYLDVKPQKNRSSSCTINIAQNSQNK